MAGDGGPSEDGDSGLGAGPDSAFGRFLKRLVLQDMALLTEPQVGSHLGGREGDRYELQERLGGGGMGVVYRAWDRELRRPVALKFLRQHTELAERLELFRREGPATAQLSHENVVRMYDVDQWNAARGPSAPFLVMECLQGETLAERLKRLEGEPLELQESLRIMRGIAAGLQHVHRVGMVHRDVKPSNVFITTEGTVKLLDFGLALLTSVPADPDARDREAGTPAYMAPEQHLGGPPTAGTDLWAAGLILHEMLSGRHPYAGARAAKLKKLICSDEPVPPLRGHRPDLPEDVHQLLATALAKSPARRLRSASDLLDRLRELEERLLPAGAAARSLPSERRQVTLLACALSCLPAGDDEEKSCELLAAYQQACVRVVHRLGGTISLCLSNEVLALFGYPRARDEDTLRAAWAALALLSEVEPELRRLCPGCTLKIGLHTGRALLSAGPDGISVQGETPRLAQELARQAEDGTALASHVTQELIRGFVATQELGAREMSGLAGTKRMRVHRLVRARKARSRFAQALAAGELTPLVGRARELERVQLLWKEVERGRGAAVLISGEPGVGKSRLCREIQQRLRPGRAPVVLQCWSQVENSAFAPVIDFCNAAFDLVATDPPQVRVEKLGRLQLELEPDEVELIAAFLSLPIPEDSPLHGLPREQRKELTLELLVRLLLREAGPEPALLVVEDLHSADPSTLKLLELLVDRIREQRALVLMTARPELVAPFSPRPQLSLLTLERLAPGESEALIREVAHGRALPGQALEALSSRAAGVPLFIEELTRSVLAQQEETGAMTELPSSLDELLAARLDRLPHRLKVLAVECAVAGLGFSAAQVAAAGGRDEASLRGDLEDLVDLGLLRWDQKGNEPTYHFRHPLLQEAAYRSQPPPVKRDRHRRFAEALQKRFPELAAAQPELLAHHLTEAGATAEAVCHWARAAEMASGRSGYAEAAAHLTRALDLLLTLPQPAPAGTPQELPLRIALGLVQSEYLGYSAQTDRTYARVLELLGRPGAKPPDEEPSLWGPFSFYFARADFQIAYEVAQRMIDFGQQLRRPYFLAVGHRMAATVLFTWGELTRAQLEMERALAYSSGRDVEQHRAVARRLVMAEKHWVDPTVMALAYAAIIRSAAGQPDDARVASAGALGLAEQIGHPFTLCYALTYTALACQLQHKAEEVVHFAGRAVALGREHRFLLWEMWARLAFSWGVSALGQPTTGIAQLRAAGERWAAAGLRAGLPHNLGMLADMHLRAGELEPGLGAVRQGLEWMERTGERSYAVELHRLHGELLRRQGDQEGARASFLQALDVAGRQGARGLGLRAACSLARQLGEQGRAHEARRLVEGALAGLQPSSAPDFHQAIDLLAALQDAPGDRPSG